MSLGVGVPRLAVTPFPLTAIELFGLRESTDVVAEFEVIAKELLGVSVPAFAVAEDPESARLSPTTRVPIADVADTPESAIVTFAEGGAFEIKGLNGCDRPSLI